MTGPRVAVASAPGRVCLAGESLDWMIGGSSVVAAIPLRTRVTAWRVPGSTVLTVITGSPLHEYRVVPTGRVASGQYDGDRLDLAQATVMVTAGRPDLIAGTVLSSDTELPVGAGVASSASFTVAATAALLALRTGQRPPVDTVFRMARMAEAGQLRTGAGWMDFLACAVGGVSRIDAEDPPRVHPIAALEVPIVVIDTLERRATPRVLVGKRERLSAGEADILAYREQAPRIVNAMTGELARSRVNYATIGQLMSTAQTLLRDRMRCSTELIDTCVRRVEAAGAYGAKLTGSGHGGCVVALVPADAIEPVLACLNDLPVRVSVLPRSEPDGLIAANVTGRSDQPKPAAHNTVRFGFPDPTA